MMELLYIRDIDTLEKFDSLLAGIDPEKPILVSDAGTIDPLLMMIRARNARESGIYLECTGRNRNRDGIRTLLITAGQMNPAGIVFGAGRFNRVENMAKPVYDLDPTQMLAMAVGLRDEKLLNSDCLLLVRAAAGSPSALARARSLLESGADYIALEGNELYDEIREKTAVIIPAVSEKG